MQEQAHLSHIMVRQLQLELKTRDEEEDAKLSRAKQEGTNAKADEATLTKDGRVSLERISCGCEPCVGFASASLRLRLALLAANAEMAVAGNEGGGDNARLD